ncbi:MATE family efflux transporter [Riemerella columbina]|uniref:MATE family efflux transporter n=1 Tax=Riemerella columbina TaxID=103810 RepID=UPI00266EB6C6|nr:MATE family efflux transporter [Riemerella columbina]WKS95316.1 MATE family efflux transporter [Riemerella columbina]
METCVTYFRIRVWGFPLTLTAFTLFGIFQGLQNTSIAMKISILGGVLNLILDVLLVFVFHWNVEGIAAASLLAQGVICFLAMRFLLQKTPFGIYRIFPIHPDFSRAMSMSFDLFLRTLALNFALFLAMRFATLLGSHGDDRYVAAHALLVQLWLFSSYFLDGYAHAGTAISGKLLGVADYTRLRHLVVDLLKIMLGIGVMLGGVYYVFREPLVAFLTVSPRVQTAFLSVFWVVACMQPLNAVAFLMDGIYKGISETKILRNVLTTAVFLAFIPALLAFYYQGWGLLGIWLSFAIWMLYRGGLLSLYFFLKYLKSKE